MAWTWRFEKADGTEVTPAVRAEEFPTQGDAESWIGEEWKELLEGGADQVSLFEDETKVYGPMSLHAEQAAPEAEPAVDTGEAEDGDAAAAAGETEGARQD